MSMNKAIMLLFEEDLDKLSIIQTVILFENVALTYRRTVTEFSFIASLVWSQIRSVYRFLCSQIEAFTSFKDESLEEKSITGFYSGSEPH
jgi:hypothetical protein